MKSRYFLILAAAALLLGTLGLSANARHAAALRDNVITKDQAGSDVAADLSQLEQFSHSHMNAGTKFELTGSYQRATAAAQPPTPSGALYAQAQQTCAGRTDSITQARCVTDYVSKRLPPAPKSAAPPDHAAYLKEFNSPAWYPDLAGLSFLVALVSFLTAGFIRLLRPKHYL